MSAIKLNSSGGGSITISPASTASNLTLTAPAQTGTIGLDGPAFRAFLSTNQSIASSTRTRVTLNSLSFDTASAFNTSTYRFTPQVAGYYSINANVSFTGTSISAVVVAIWKNGLEASNANFQGTIAAANVSLSDLVYLNGSTDFIELYAQINGSSPVIGANSVNTFLAGALVRAA